MNGHIVKLEYCTLKTTRSHSDPEAFKNYGINTHENIGNYVLKYSS